MFKQRLQGYGLQRSLLQAMHNMYSSVCSMRTQRSFLGFLNWGQYNLFLDRNYPPLGTLLQITGFQLTERFSKLDNVRAVHYFSITSRQP
jgi:hypothetical protein